MVSFLLLVIGLSFSLSLMLSSAPLFLGLWVLFMALIVALLLGVSTFSWVGLLMFLIYVGGLLVMFAYFVALSPNEVIEGKSMMLFFFFTLFLVSGLFWGFYVLDGYGISFFMGVSVFYLLVLKNIYIFIFLSLVLFFALVSVVKICSFSSSPLRPFMNYV